MRSPFSPRSIAKTGAKRRSQWRPKLPNRRKGNRRKNRHSRVRMAHVRRLCDLQLRGLTPTEFADKL